ncbi:MAG TPA: SDR family NAD(P)-dependent oxidoreductase [Candidatus Dormibacteraeota bacterium]|nr:SDR family NAD(P)-dependent oxidoreductase [Candidatus Dormibacteraeota bacterium]
MNAVTSFERIVLLGGNSDIGLATVRALVADGARDVTLAGRHLDDLEAHAAQLKSIGASGVRAVRFDAADLDSHQGFVDDVFGGADIDVVILAFGVLGDQRLAEVDAAAALDVLRVNLDGAISVGVPVVQKLAGQGHGHLVVLSSVAAERPRRDNFAYAASKAGLDAFFQGMAEANHERGVHIMVVRPGRMHTRMTEGMPEVPFTTDPDHVAADILKGLRRGSMTIWSPAPVRVLMSVLRHLPRPLYRRVTRS